MSLFREQIRVSNYACELGCAIFVTILGWRSEPWKDAPGGLRRLGWRSCRRPVVATSGLNHKKTRREYTERATCLDVAGVEFLKGQAD